MENKKVEQRVLTIKVGEEKTVSKPWDFEAMCIVDDERTRRENENSKGIYRTAKNAVYYLFEGTAVTTDVLDQAPNATLMAMCRKVYGWFADDVAESVKNE